MRKPGGKHRTPGKPRIPTQRERKTIRDILKTAKWLKHGQPKLNSVQTIEFLVDDGYPRELATRLIERNWGKL